MKNSRENTLDTFYKPHVWYEITINPDDKHQCFGKPDRIESFRNFMYEQFISWPQIGVHYYFTIELSEPRHNKEYGGIPRLHLHGVFKCNSRKSVKHFLLHEVYKLTRYSIYEIDTMTDSDVWRKYIHKQQDIINISPLTNLDGWPIEEKLEDLFDL